VDLAVLAAKNTTSNSLGFPIIGLGIEYCLRSVYLLNIRITQTVQQLKGKVVQDGEAKV
jgi:hypothetical protein